jgi:hypothetical protein
MHNAQYQPTELDSILLILYHGIWHGIDDVFLTILINTQLTCEVS